MEDVWIFHYELLLENKATILQTTIMAKASYWWKKIEEACFFVTTKNKRIWMGNYGILFWYDCHLFRNHFSGKFSNSEHYARKEHDLFFRSKWKSFHFVRIEYWKFKIKIETICFFLIFVTFKLARKTLHYLWDGPIFTEVEQLGFYLDSNF